MSKQKPLSDDLANNWTTGVAPSKQRRARRDLYEAEFGKPKQRAVSYAEADAALWLIESIYGKQDDGPRMWREKGSNS